MPNSYTITNTELSARQLQKIYTRIISEKDVNCPDLNNIFEIASNNLSLFPNINIGGRQDEESYLLHWIDNYLNAYNNLPHQRIKDPKNECDDPAVQMLVQTFKNYTQNQTYEAQKTHNLFMSAENVQGNLLEEFIATKIRPYGFLWCMGEILRSTDFCNQNGTCLLQIKNKYNTENSSSSNIREGTTIKKWYRLKKKITNGVPIPDFRWDLLNDIVNQNATEQNEMQCSISEQDYQEFLRNTIIENHSIINEN